MDIQREVNEILHSQFEIPYDRLVPEAHLYDELELDSLDAADLLVLLEQRSGLTIMPETFMEARTLDDICRVVASLIDSAQRESKIDRSSPVRPRPEASETDVLESN